MHSPLLLCLALITGFLVQDIQTPKKSDPVLQDPAQMVMVSGRVVYEDTGQPATRHRVQLIAVEALGNARNGLRIPTAITNERGEFSLEHVSAGQYYAFAEAMDRRGSQELTMVLTRSGDDAADAARQAKFKKNNPKVTVDGLRNIEVNLRVPNPHFGTISGIVFDATHQPAARAQVRVLSKASDAFATSTRTDDQGRYKVRGLPKGEYIVSASPPPKETGDGERNRNLQGSPGATYYPSTSISGNSPAVVVLPDIDTANVDVTLIAKTLRNLAGTLRMRGDNRPITNGALRLMVKQLADSTSDTSQASAAEVMTSSYSSSTDKSGRWSFANVPDGTYRLFVQPSGPPTMTLRFVPLEQDISVNGSDIEDLSLEVSEGARMSGVVTIEGSGEPPLNITVSAMTYTPNANASVTIDEAGKFTLTAVPMGEVVVSAFMVPDNKFYVKSIEANGLDLLRNNITIAEGDEIKDVRVVLSSGVGVVTGRVLTQGDKPVAGANVMLFPTGKEKVRLAGGRLSGSTDERGNFTLSAMPGTYLVMAWRSADGPGAYGAAQNRAVREQGEGGVTLSANERKQLDIRLP